MITPTPSKLLALFMALAMAWPAAPALAQGSLPALGDSASDDLDIGDERRLGEQIMRDIRRDPAFLDDPVLQNYVQGLWQPLVASGRQLGHIGPDLERAYPWELFLVRDASVNAFALPGGHVGVHLGLIAMTTHADELASVMAHELVHVTQRHIARSIGSGKRGSMVSVAAMMLGLLLASRAGSADAAQAAVLGGQAAMIQGQLNFSRDMEREADRIGYGMLETAGYSPRSMASMFEKLSVANRLNDSGSFPYLRSHPLTTDRIAEARARVPDGTPPVEASLVHALMRVRASALMDPTTATLRRLQEAPLGTLPQERLAGLYQRALVSTRLKDAAAARESLGPLLEAAARPEVPPEARRVVHWLAVEVALGAGPAPQMAELAQMSSLLPESDGQRPAVLLRAQAVRATLPAAGADAPARLRRSLEELQSWVAEHPSDAGAWHQLSLTAAAAGQPVRALRADAEMQAALGDLPGAVDRLRTARRADGTNEAIELQVIDARLRALQGQLRLLMQDETGRGR